MASILTIDGPISSGPRDGAATVNCVFERPNDTTAYAAGDCVSNSTSSANHLMFAGIGMQGYITDVALVMETVGGAGSWGDFRLFLFDRPPTSYLDNDPASSVTNTEMARLIHAYKFSAAHSCVMGPGAAGAAGLTVCHPIDGIGVYDADWVSFASSDSNIYGLLTTASAWTPAANQRFAIRLSVFRGAHTR